MPHTAFTHSLGAFLHFDFPKHTKTSLTAHIYMNDCVRPKLPQGLISWKDIYFIFPSFGCVCVQSGKKVFLRHCTKCVLTLAGRVRSQFDVRDIILPVIAVSPLVQDGARQVRKVLVAHHVHLILYLRALKCQKKRTKMNRAHLQMTAPQ